MARVVANAKTAFSFYQTVMIEEIQRRLGPEASMEAAMNEVCMIRFYTSYCNILDPLSLSSFTCVLISLL
jgi:hypothetical protein